MNNLRLGKTTVSSRMLACALFALFLCAPALADTILVETGCGNAQQYNEAYDKTTPVSISGTCGDASATVDWAKGQMHFLGNAYYTSSGQLNDSGVDIVVQDMLYVVGSSAGNLVISLQLNGIFSGDPYGQSAQAEIQLRAVDQNNQWAPGYSDQTWSCSGYESSVCNGTATAWLVINPAYHYQLYAHVSGGTWAATEDSSMDFSHTATFSLSVPQGDTWSSQSGTFLTAATQPASTPEPATFSLLASGLLAAGFALRRKLRQ